MSYIHYPPIDAFTNQHVLDPKSDIPFMYEYIIKLLREFLDLETEIKKIEKRQELEDAIQLYLRHVTNEMKFLNPEMRHVFKE